MEKREHEHENATDREQETHSSQEIPSAQNRKISRRKLMASMGLAGAAVVSGGLVSTLGEKAFAAEKKEKDEPITDDADRISYSYSEDAIEWTVGDKLRESVSVKDFGAKGDASTDDTAAFNHAIDFVAETGGVVFVPYSQSPYMIHPLVSILMKSNVNLVFAEGATIQAIPVSEGKYAIIKCENITDFSIKNGVIIGERKEHLGSTGEWGMGIDLRGVSRFLIDKTKVSDCWGDGIYISSSSNQAFCQDGIFNLVECDNNRRQGISQISGKHLTYISPILKNTNGTSPQAGIDLEPNTADDFCENINIIHPITMQNKGAGIIVSINALVNAGKEVSVTISNHKDSGSSSGFRLGKCRGTLDGSIRNIHPEYVNNEGAGFFARDYHSTGPRCEIIKPYIKNPRKALTSPGTSPKYHSLTAIYRESADSDFGKLGNIHIIEPFIDEERGLGYSSLAVVDENGLGSELVSFFNPTFLSNKKVYRGGVIEVRDDYEQITNHLSAENALNLTRVMTYTHIDNSGAPSDRSINVSATIHIGTKIKLTVKKPYLITFQTPATQLIKPFQTTSAPIRSKTVGSSVTLVKLSDTEWIVENIIGSWEGLN